MAVYDVSLYEPIHPGWTADSVAVTADSIVYTADGSPLIPAVDASDAAINANILTADIYEPVAHVWTADSTTITADSNYWTADGGPLEGARDVTDAEVIAVELPITGGGYPALRPRPFPVEGYAFGVLPQLVGDAIGTVVVAGRGLGRLPDLSGAAAGTVGVAGRSAGRILIRGVASGQRGQVGTAIGILKGLSIASEGVTGVCGSSSGVIAKFEGAASGRHDDDEAAVITFLLAA